MTFLKPVGYYFIVYVFTFIIAILFSILNCMIFNKVPRKMKDMVMVGTPFIFSEDQEYFSCIDDVLVGESYVYIGYREMFLVKVYTTDGSYICTLMVSDKNTHGARMSMYVQKDTLYLTAGSDIYEFQGTMFMHYYPFDIDMSLLTNINKERANYRNKSDNNAYHYYKKGESVYRMAPNGLEEVFVKRSPMYYLCNPIFSWILWVLFFIMHIFPTVLVKIKQ